MRSPEGKESVSVPEAYYWWSGYGVALEPGEEPIKG